MDKRELTKSIIEEADLSIPLDVAVREWWWGPTHSLTFRLTYHGFKALKPLVRSFTYKTDQTMNGRILIKLGKLNCPYFLNANKHEVTILSNKIATVITLYGDFDAYLNTIE